MSSIVALSRYRWTLPILAQLARSGGSRFVPLAHQLGLSRDALRQTLDALIEVDLVVPNPGYGHPTRPEYILSESGGQVAPACAQLVEYLRRSGLADVALKKWSLPAVAALAGPRRYGELRRAVGASSRALSLALKELAEAGLVERRVHDGFPPSTTYRLTSRGRALRDHVVRLKTVLEEIAPARPAGERAAPRVRRRTPAATSTR
jgi:DNA-binding HxlR family transcriptional regulator